jgi:glucose-6-phosphate 1-dehydrogenase
VQPDEAIYFRVMSKTPGLGLSIEARNLDLRYKAAFKEQIPDAYESLLLDVIRGEKSLFIGKDELAAAWDVFTPFLHATEGRGVEPYEFGSAGPAAANRLAERLGAKWA